MAFRATTKFALLLSEPAELNKVSNFVQGQQQHFGCVSERRQSRPRGNERRDSEVCRSVEYHPPLLPLLDCPGEAESHSPKEKGVKCDIQHREKPTNKVGPVPSQFAQDKIPLGKIYELGGPKQQHDTNQPCLRLARLISRLSGISRTKKKKGIERGTRLA